MLRRVSRGRTNTLFLLLVCAVLFTAVVDVLEVFTFNVSAKYILNYLYFFIRNSTLPLYILFLTSYMGIWHRLRGFNPLTLLILIPFIIDMLIIVANPYTCGVFYIDEDCVYHRGGSLYVLYIIAFYYIALSIAVIICNRKLIGIREMLILSGFQAVNAIAVYVQMLLPGFRIEIFGTTILSILVAVGVHKPEEYMDSVVGISTSAGFLMDVRKTLLAGRPVAVILFKYTNHAVLRESIGYELYTKLTRKLADKLKQINSLTGSKAELYYLDKGTYAVIAPYTKYNMIYNFGRMLTDYVRSPIKLDIMEVKLDSRVCLINCPSDISNEDAFIDFVNSLEFRVPEDDNLVILADVSESKEFKMRNDMNTIIARGISGHNFQMYYQPIYSIREKRFTSAEALIRLIDEEYGFVSPAFFIPVAEVTGAIHQIGDYVIDEVCRFISSDAYKELNLDYIEINLSVAQCIEADLPDKFRAAMKKYGITPSKLNLEITETAADYDPAVTDHNIAVLSDMGFSFSLDDYGTGYSNIKRVVTLPLDIVKLDKCLVDDMNNETMGIVIRNTVSMLKNMDKKILVEGIEQKEAFDRFSMLGCDYIQGFYFSKPLPEREFIRFIRRMEGEKHE